MELDRADGDTLADEADSDYKCALDINGQRYIAAAMLPLIDPDGRLPTFIPQRVLRSARLHRRRASVSASAPLSRHRPTPARSRDVAALSDISAVEFCEEFVRRNLPCVIRGAARRWPATTRWRDDDYLRRVAGHAAIKRTTSIRADLGFGHESPMEAVRFDEFLDVYRDEPRYYVNDSDIPEPLRPDLGSHAVHRGFEKLEDYCRRTGMFMGAGGQTAPLHYDDEDNLYMLLDGEKRFVLFDAADFRRMYANHHRRAPDFSAADPDDHDLRRFPLMADATRYIAHLYPGDILYIPAYWWHAVTSIGRNIAVSDTRTDRISQLRAFIKLVQNDALPLSTDHQARLLDMIDRPADTARRTVGELTPDQLLQYDVFTLYVKLGLLYAHRREHGQCADEVTAMYDAIRDPVARRIRDAYWSFPVLYLMQNFYRCDTRIFMV